MLDDDDIELFDLSRTPEATKSSKSPPEGAKLLQGARGGGVAEEVPVRTSPLPASQPPVPAAAPQRKPRGGGVACATCRRSIRAQGPAPFLRSVRAPTARIFCEQCFTELLVANGAAPVRKVDAGTFGCCPDVVVDVGGSTLCCAKCSKRFHAQCAGCADDAAAQFLASSLCRTGWYCRECGASLVKNAAVGQKRKR